MQPKFYANQANTFEDVMMSECKYSLYNELKNIFQTNVLII